MSAKGSSAKVWLYLLFRFMNAGCVTKPWCNLQYQELESLKLLMAKVYSNSFQAGTKFPTPKQCRSGDGFCPPWKWMSAQNWLSRGDRWFPKVWGSGVVTVFSSGRFPSPHPSPKISVKLIGDSSVPFVTTPSSHQWEEFQSLQPHLHPSTALLLQWEGRGHALQRCCRRYHLSPPQLSSSP